MSIAAKSAQPQVYRNCIFLRQEITQAASDIDQRAALCVAAAKTLHEAFDAERPGDVKVAAVNLKTYAAGLAKVAQQIEALTGSMADVFGTHIARRTQ